uniref:DEAD-box ATP-dependent RNA helicase RhpA n=1 Tax=Schlesneria paludicola TaxID=360056 RepID=A0A7C2P9W2_9PLAN
MRFSELGLSEPLVRAVTAEGYDTATPIQAAAIPIALSGRDLIGLAQTGTGKTAAFALPLLHRLLQSTQPRGPKTAIRALILSPTRELAQQIAESLAVYGRHTELRSTVVVGGVGMGPQIRAVTRGVDVLVATPGRLEDLRQQGHIDLRAVEIFVLDEADRMLDVGFLPDIQRITKVLPAHRQTLLISATMPAAVRNLADGILRHPARVEIAPVQATTELITQSVCFVPKPDKARLLATLLKTQPVTRAIVFTRTKRGADRVAEQLGKIGIRAEAIHGNKSQGARQRSLAQFRAARPPVLVATDLAARGLDVDGISHVVNFDLPHEPEVYVHRIGRTGRAGATGVAVAFCDETERNLLRAIERLLKRPLPTDRVDGLTQERSRAPADRSPLTLSGDAARQHNSKPAHQFRRGHGVARSPGSRRPR